MLLVTWREREWVMPNDYWISTTAETVRSGFSPDSARSTVAQTGDWMRRVPPAGMRTGQEECGR